MTNVRLWNMDLQLIGSGLKNVDLPLNMVTKRVDSITLPEIDPLIFIARNPLLPAPLMTSLQDESNGSVGFFKQWRAILSKGSKGTKASNGDSMEDNSTIVVSPSQSEWNERSFVAHLNNVTLDDIADIPTFNGLMLDEEMYAIYCFLIVCNSIFTLLSFAGFVQQHSKSM